MAFVARPGEPVFAASFFGFLRGDLWRGFEARGGRVVQFVARNPTPDGVERQSFRALRLGPLFVPIG